MRNKFLEEALQKVKERGLRIHSETELVIEQVVAVYDALKEEVRQKVSRENALREALR